MANSVSQVIFTPTDPGPFPVTPCPAFSSSVIIQLFWMPACGKFQAHHHHPAHPTTITYDAHPTEGAIQSNFKPSPTPKIHN